MVSSSSILHAVLLAWASQPSEEPEYYPPDFVVPIAARWNTTGRPFKSGQRGASRAAFLRTKAQNKYQGSSSRAVISEPIEDDTTIYVASVAVGSAGTTYNLIVDTTSGNTWLGANKAYVVTATSRPAGSSVEVTFGGEIFSGTEFQDQVVLADVAMPNKSIGVVTPSTVLNGIDGILGIGPEELAIGTLASNLTQGIPTIVQTLSCQGNITTQLYAIALQPTTSVMSLNGEISWGGVDSTKFTGPIAWSSITMQAPSAEFWGIEMAFSYGATSLLPPTAAGIIDTGSTLLFLASDAYSRYAALTGATLDSATGLLTVPSIANLQPLVVVMNGTSFTFSPNAQLWPRALNTAIGGSCCKIYLVIADLGSPSGSGLDFILGLVFLQRFYSVFDYINAQVGLAVTPFTNATSN
ncbi:family A1 protease [Mycena latifolia]|nr:family A1 protease [Mycena latifolia]